LTKAINSDSSDLIAHGVRTVEWPARGEQLAADPQGAMMKTYSVTIWMVKPGREAEFIRSWLELAEFTALHMVGRKEASRLLRDHDQPNRFVSLAPWDSAATLQAWRAGPGFGERVGRMRELLEDFTPMTLNDVPR
jgi:heme-degrading monooxygenase HmoA